VVSGPTIVCDTATDPIATMPMEAQKPEDLPYTTLKSSCELGWSSLVAELRSYHCCERVAPITLQAQILIALATELAQTAPR